MITVIAPRVQESNNLKRGDPEDSRLAAIEDIPTLEQEQVSGLERGYKQRRKETEVGTDGQTARQADKQRSRKQQRETAAKEV